MSTLKFEKYLSIALFLKFDSTLELPGKLLKIANTWFRGWEWGLAPRFLKSLGWAYRAAKLENHCYTGTRVTFTATFRIPSKIFSVPFSNHVRLIPKCTLCFYRKCSFSLLTSHQALHMSSLMIGEVIRPPYLIFLNAITTSYGDPNTFMY